MVSCDPTNITENTKERRQIIINNEIYVEFPEVKYCPKKKISVYLVPISEVNSDFTELIPTNGCNSDVQNSEHNEQQCEFSISNRNCNEDDESLVNFHKTISDKIEYMNNTLFKSNCNYMSPNSKSNVGLGEPLKEKLDEDFNDSLVIDLRENEELLEDSDVTIKKINKVFKPFKLKFKYVRHGGVNIKIGDYFPINNFSLSPKKTDENPLLNENSKLKNKLRVPFKYKCPYCSYKLFSSFKFFRHLFNHVETCFCSTCDSSVTLTKINFHIRNGHVETIRCFVCSFETKEESTFKHHLMISHKKKIMTRCSICGCVLELNPLLPSQIEILSKHLKEKHPQQNYRAS